MIEEFYDNTCGHCFVCDDRNEIESNLLSLCLGFNKGPSVKEYIRPGDMTNFRKFFDRDVEFVGMRNDGELEDTYRLFFYLGEEKNLFGTRHYYEDLWLIGGCDLFKMYKPGEGRKFHDAGGIWEFENQ